MDEQLVALVQAVEAGGLQSEDVNVRVFLAGGAFQGVVRPSAAFADMTEPAWASQLAKEWHRGWGKPKADTQDKANQWVQETLRPIRQSRNDQPNALTLGPAVFWPFGGAETVQLPSVRIALESIEAWCFVLGKVTENKGESSWFVGGFWTTD